MTPEKAAAILSAAWNDRDPHVHGCELFVASDPSGKLFFRVDVSSETTFTTDQWRVPLTSDPTIVTRWRVVGQVWPEHGASPVGHEEEFGYQASAEARVNELNKAGFDFEVREFQALQVERYRRTHLHTKHLYFSDERDESHVVALIEKGIDLLPTMVANSRDPVGTHPVPEHHEAVDDLEIPRVFHSAGDWTSVFRIGSGVVSP